MSYLVCRNYRIKRRCTEMVRLFSSVLCCVVFTFYVCLSPPTCSKEWQNEKSEDPKSYFRKSVVQPSSKEQELILGSSTNNNSIQEEMYKFIELQIGQNSVASIKNLADSLLEFLKNKYDTKMWIVVVMNSTSCRGVRLSKEFYQVEINRTRAAAISVKRDDWTELSSISRYFLKNFKFPGQTVKGFQFSSVNKNDIHKYIDRYLEPMRKVVDTHTLTVECDVYSDKDVTIVHSNPIPYYILQRDPSKVDLIVAFIAVKPSASFSSANSALDFVITNNQECRWNIFTENSGPLRNPLNNKYLSVENDSMEDRAHIIVDEWKNSPSQRWRFVDNQLRNDNGKCLTAKYSQSWYLYQYDCNKNWTGQKWYRNGLQIVNGFHFCLVQLESYNGYVVQDKCRFEDNRRRSEHWQNSHMNCLKQMNKPKLYEDYGVLYMASFNLYLTAYEDNDDVSINSWTNDPGQYWRFENGKLINFNGKCLIFSDDSWFVKTVACNQTGNHELTFNWKKQIVYDERYCLVMRNTYHYDKCRDGPEQRWVYMS